MKNLRPILTRLLVLQTLFVIGVFGNTVTPDTSFNDTGYYLQQIGEGNAKGDSLAMQSDGKIIVGGTSKVNPKDIDRFAVMRLNTDGTLDTTFGSNGITISSVDGAAWDTKLLIQPDGKILMSATSWAHTPTFYDFFLLRFTSDGEIDTTFNGNGFAKVDVNDLSFDICFGMALQPDGKIILVGRTEKPGQTLFDIAIMRLNQDGSLDSTFDDDGILKIDSPGFTLEAHSAFVQADGKILIGGTKITNIKNFLLTRLNSDGSTDTTFGTNGTRIWVINTIENKVNSLAQQSDGRILASGGGLISRLSANGIRDMSFGKDGAATTAASGALNFETDEIRVLDDDKFLITMRGDIRRFLANGVLDTNFMGNFRPPDNFCHMKSVSLQSDGKVVLGGGCSNTNDGISRFAVFRVEENRTKRFLDFDGNETSEMSIFRPSTGEWLYLQATFIQRVAGQFGAAGDIPVPADYTGDGRTDLAVFRPSTGEWFISRSGVDTYYSFPFGTEGDVPVAADYDGDNIADPAVFRPSTNEWIVRKSTGGVSFTIFGSDGDIPVPSDYDGDFKTDIAIYRPSNGSWWFQRSSDDNFYALQFGTSTDIPVPGEYTGDNKTDVAFWRPSTGEWFVLRSEDNSYFAAPFGADGDLPAPGNYSGDSRFDLAVFRPSTNEWHILPMEGDYFRRIFGAAGDQILPNIVVP